MRDGAENIIGDLGDVFMTSKIQICIVDRAILGILKTIFDTRMKPGA